MGMKLSRKARELIAKAQARDRQANPQKYAPAAGRLTLFIPGDPPTVTHHDKRIERRGKSMTLVDSPALRAARDHYLRGIPQQQGGPIAGPLLARITFCFTDTSTRPHAPEWMTDKPDLDNAAKALIDAIAERGWIGNDSHVSRLILEKAFVAAPCGVVVRVETLLTNPAIEWPARNLSFEPFFTNTLSL